MPADGRPGMLVGMERTRGRRRLKRVLITPAVVVGVLGAAVGGSFAWLWTSADISTVGKARFGDALSVPPLAPSTVDKDGTRVFDLRMRPGERTVLRSYPWRDGDGWERRFNGGDDSFDVLRLRAADGDGPG